MPDNNKNDFDLESDYNFAALSDFESGGKPSQASESGAPDFEEFETAGGGEPDFASFAEEPQFEDSTAEVDFGAQDFEPASDFAGGGDFDFGMPPSPQSVELESLSGNPDEEFGDFAGGGDFGGNDDFPGENDTPADPYAEDDAVPSKGYAAGSVDPFADDDQDAAQPEDAASEQATKDNTKPGIKHYAGIAAVAAIVGYIGYSQVLPMFVSTDAGQTVTDAAPVIKDGNPLANLPPIDTSAQPAEEIAGLQQPTAVQQPISEPVDGTAVGALPPIDLPGTPATDEKPAPVDTAAVVDASPSLNLPGATSPAEQAPATETQAAVDPLDEMVGGKDRGGLDSMKEDAVEAVPVKEAAPVANADIAALASRLDEVVKRIETIEQKVASFGASFEGNTEIKTPVADVKPSVTLSAVVDGGVSAPLKPPIIENVVLRGVSRDIAWIATGKGVVEVKVGDSIEDAGVVESFQNYRGRWIAVTDKGIILPR